MPAYTHRNGGSSLVETLSSTTVDTITLPASTPDGGFGDSVTVWNLNGTDALYIIASSVATPADPVANAPGVVAVPAGQARTLRDLGSAQATLKVVGNGNIYGVQRHDRAVAGATPPLPLRTFVTVDLANLVDGAGVSQSVTVQGAALGMQARATFSVSTQGMIVTADVTAANTVTVRVQNESTGAIDLTSATVEVVVYR